VRRRGDEVNPARLGEAALSKVPTFGIHTGGRYKIAAGAPLLQVALVSTGAPPQLRP
jgi:hypothetical protein